MLSLFKILERVYISGNMIYFNLTVFNSLIICIFLFTTFYFCRVTNVKNALSVYIKCAYQNQDGVV